MGYTIFMVWFTGVVAIIVPAILYYLIDSVKRERAFDRHEEVYTCDGARVRSNDDIMADMALELYPILIAALVWPRVLLMALRWIILSLLPGKSNSH